MLYDLADGSGTIETNHVEAIGPLDGEQRGVRLASGIWFGISFEDER